MASVGPILCLAELERIVGSQWAWFGDYGDDLLAELLAISIPPMTPKAPEARGTKRPAAHLDNVTMGYSGDGGRKEKRVKTHLEPQEAVSPNPVNITPTFTPLAHATWPATPLTMNPYSRLMMPYPSIYYSPYPYHPNFYYPNTPPTQWRTPSQIPNTKHQPIFSKCRLKFISE